MTQFFCAGRIGEVAGIQIPNIYLDQELFIGDNMKQIAVSLLAILLFGCSTQSKPSVSSDISAQLPTTLEEAVKSTVYRNPENLVRDKYRHPVETLNFFGITHSMNVVEVVPGGG